MNTESTAKTPLIDFEQLNSACDGDLALMKELMDMYFGQADEIMVGLKTAVAEKSAPDVDHLAHKLAGSSLACGLNAIVPPVRQMEMRAKSGSLEGAETSLAEAVVALEMLREAVQVHLKPKS